MQSELAERIGVGRTTLASWETGHRRPELAHLESLADLAGVSLDWLVGRTGANETANAKDDLVIIFNGQRQELSEPVLRIVRRILEDEAAERAKKALPQAQSPGEAGH